MPGLKLANLVFCEPSPSDEGTSRQIKSSCSGGGFTDEQPAMTDPSSLLWALLLTEGMLDGAGKKGRQAFSTGAKKMRDPQDSNLRAQSALPQLEISREAD